ncbi:MAG: acyltransferase family protein [Gammaproteobacteria bacterium]|nr:acyltransferase family protein [Gammaproteobacteria bacterium]
MEKTRLHALDAIRGFALLLGLLVHGSMSFWPGLVELGFPISDTSKSMTLTFMFYVLHMFRMTVFFLIAGFFAHLSLHRKGSQAFLKDRMKRIALPMGVAWIPSLLLIVPVTLWAASKLYGAEYLDVMQAGQDSAPPGPILMHFWFLYYLLWFYFIAVACSKFLSKLDVKERLMNAVTSFVYFLCRYHLLVLLATAISTWVFFLRENWVFWAGIPTPTEAVWNEAPAFFIYGLAFFVGWVFDRKRECLVIIKNHWQLYLGLALVMTIISTRWLEQQPFVISVVIDSDKLLFAFCYSLASWCWILGLVGAGMKFFDQENATRRYVADASYWIFIAHIPVLFFLQTAFMQVPLHWAIKFPLILAIATPILFWTYDKWVRYTLIGNVLNGPRQRPEQHANITVST